MEEAWFQALQDVSDDEGKKAFASLMRATTFGDVKPGHIIEKVEAAKAAKSLETGSDIPWISSAPKFSGIKDHTNPSPEWRRWLESEKFQLYRSVDSRTQEIVLIANPEAWDWTLKDNRPYFIRPEPIMTGQKAPQEKTPWNQRERNRGA